jgi:hypothetical protein
MRQHNVDQVQIHRKSDNDGIVDGLKILEMLATTMKVDPYEEHAKDLLHWVFKGIAKFVCSLE